ncbi:MAG: hypothetical protein AAFN30_08100 [Actinomycetota bacterium]
MRADWRFLVPWDEERAPTILVGADRRAAWMEEDGWAVSEGPADVVAVDDGPALEAVAAGARHLVVWTKPAGWWRADGGWARTARPLDLPEHRCRTYLPLPASGQPRTYLPLDPDAGDVVADWLGARLPAAAAGLARPGSRLLGALGRRRGVVIVATAAPGGSRAEGDGGPPPVFVVATSGHDEGSRAVRVRLDRTPDGGRRAVVEKFTNRPRYRANSDGEQAALAAVRAALPAPLAAAVPEPLGIDVRAGATRVTESYLPGPTMAQALGPRSRRRVAVAALDRALRWFDGVHRVTGEPFCWSTESTERWLDAPLEALGEHGDCGRLRSLVAAVAERAEGGRAATVLRHYDPGPWNLVLGPDLGVIDWEARPPRPVDRRGLALADHLYLLCYWRHVVVGTRSRADEWAVSGLTPPTTSRRRWAVTAGRSRLLAAADALGVDRRVVPALWVHNWLEQAVFTARRRPDGRPGVGIDHLRWAGPDGEHLLALWDGVSAQDPATRARRPHPA